LSLRHCAGCFLVMRMPKRDKHATRYKSDGRLSKHICARGRFSAGPVSDPRGADRGRHGDASAPSVHPLNTRRRPGRPSRPGRSTGAQPSSRHSRPAGGDRQTPVAAGSGGPAFMLRRRCTRDIELGHQTPRRPAGTQRLIKKAVRLKAGNSIRQGTAR
jgi:hypothetical protein